MDLLTYLRAQWDRIAGYGCVAVGASLTVSGAIQMSRSRSILSQLSYLGSGALIGLFLLVLGIGLVVSAGLHDEWHKLDEIQTAIQADRLAAAPGAAEAAEAAIADLREAPNGARPSATMPVLR